MVRARTLFWICALAALTFAGPAAATSVTVQITGTWDSVTDNAGVTDGSITVGGSFTATLVYDDSVPDIDASAGFGAYSSPAVSSDLSIVTGNYTLAPASDVGLGVENDNAFGEDWTYISATGYSLSGPLPGGVGSGSPAFADFTFTDYSATVHSSDALLGVSWNLGDYDDAFLHVFVAITGAGPLKSVDLMGTITTVVVLPEPSILGLIGTASIIALRRRG